MAEIVASLVHDGEHLLLDASTTAVFVAKALKEKERLTVITNSMEILLELADVSGWNIISTGGMMKEGYLAFLGSRTEEVIRSYFVDTVIFSCKALDENWGVMESQEAFGTAKRAMLDSGRKKILVVDNTKFDQTAFSVAGRLRDVDIVVTDAKPSEKWLKLFTPTINSEKPADSHRTIAFRNYLLRPLRRSRISRAGTYHAYSVSHPAVSSPPVPSAYRRRSVPPFGRQAAACAAGRSAAGVDEAV